MTETLLLLLAGALAFLWFSRRPMTMRLRQQAPGQFARLRDGLIHYQWHGPEGGPVLVLVHGLTTPSFVWRALLPRLERGGYRILTYDHFGRGYSDRPWRRYDLAFYRRTLAELLDKLELGGPVHLLGYSMGGGIVTDFADHNPERVASLTLVAPVGLGRTEIPWAARTPVLGDLMMLVLGPSILCRQARAAAAAEGLDPEIAELQCREARTWGYTRAVLSSLRHAIFLDQRKTHARLARRSLPVLAIFGGADTLIGEDAAEALAGCNPNARIVAVPGAGHSLVLTHAEAVAQPILSFLPPPRR